MRIWLRDIRKSRNLTQTELAAMCGITQQSYQAIEAGDVTPRPDTAMRIGKALGFPWTRFYTEEDNHDTDSM